MQTDSFIQLFNQRSNYSYMLYNDRSVLLDYFSNTKIISNLTRYKMFYWSAQWFKLNHCLNLYAFKVLQFSSFNLENEIN